jgi:hypothetical protein
MHKVFLTEAGGSSFRGILPNFYAPSGNLPASPGDTFTGRGSLAGKSFIFMDVGNNVTRGRAIYDITPVL